MSVRERRKRDMRETKRCLRIPESAHQPPHANAAVSRLSTKSPFERGGLASGREKKGQELPPPPSPLDSVFPEKREKQRPFHTCWFRTHARTHTRVGPAPFKRDRDAPLPSPVIEKLRAEITFSGIHVQRSQREGEGET